jgi:large subunit ribosomal protein L7A
MLSLHDCFHRGELQMVDRLIGKKVVGVKQSLKAIGNGEGKVVYIAKDADNKIIDSVESLVKQFSLELIYVDTMKELGKLCGIDVGAATAVILND